MSFVVHGPLVFNFVGSSLTNLIFALLLFNVLYLGGYVCSTRR